MSLFVFLLFFIWIHPDTKAENIECLKNPRSSNCVALSDISSKSVDELEIFQASMTTLPTSYFLQFGYQNVSEIKLCSSHVRNIEDDAFAGLTRLKRLHLSNNFLKTLTSAGFRGLEQLDMLVLSFNKIDKIEEGTLKGLTSLIYLNIRNNELSVIPNEIQELNNLKYLDMSHNDFSNVNVILKSNSLNFLRLSSCKIVTLTENSFKGTPQLQLLDISYNLLTTLPFQLLQPLTALVVFDVSDNLFDNGFPNIYKPENLTNVTSKYSGSLSDLLKYINETKSKSYSSKLLNKELLNKIASWLIPMLCIFGALFSYFLYAVITSTNKFKLNQ
ncbi:leucine-rich repeat-containing protein 70-like [Agrilus planipennis]|uniref:Leucine-rich repeat-containing protein 70-like n=1 Tax=Agrilus planipennis TaxID=224129 RepID=A0A1W4WEZ8_AGRPL|nr:leucine-rich repeat-containing protein 70-like [Agrilus planipennis]